MEECIFCKIAQHQTPADILYEDDLVIVFKDIKPSAPIHLLITTKEHIKSVNQLQAKHQKLIARMVLTAKKMAAEQKTDHSGYKLLFNVGRGGGQLVDHLHLHLLGGGDLRG